MNFKLFSLVGTLSLQAFSSNAYIFESSSQDDHSQKIFTHYVTEHAGIIYLTTLKREEQRTSGDYNEGSLMLPVSCETFYPKYAQRYQPVNYIVFLDWTYKGTNGNRVFHISNLKVEFANEVELQSEYDKNKRALVKNICTDEVIQNIKNLNMSEYLKNFPMWRLYK